MVPVQYDKLEKERMAGIVPPGQVTGFFYCLMKRPLRKISPELPQKIRKLLLRDLPLMPEPDNIVR